MKRFINDIKRYWNYIVYSTKSELKTEIINSHLGWIWMVLEPLCFMLIYTFIAVIVFKSSVDYFPIFVFIGLAIWNFFNKMIVISVKLVASNRDIVTKVYVPKFVLLLTKMGVNLFKMGVSILMIIIFMIFYRVPLSINVLWALPIILTSIIFTFGVCTIVMHIGVFVEDLTNVINIVMKLVFYLTGIFFDISTKINNIYYRTILLRLNPLANLISSLRNVTIYQKGPDVLWLGIWLIIGILLSIIGIKTIYENENTYVKVMK